MSNNNPWRVNSVQAFLCLKCPECDYNTNQETFFQDHAVENHPLSIALFGKIKSLYITSLLFDEETEEEIEGKNITEVNSKYKAVQLNSSEKSTLAINAGIVM